MNDKLPVFVLKDAVLFPYSEIRLELQNEEQKKLMSLVESYYNKQVLIVNQLDPLEEKTDILELPDYGVLGNLQMRLDLPNGKTRVVIKGIKRINVKSYVEEDEIFLSDYEIVKPAHLDKFEEVAYSRSLVRQLELFVNSVSYISNSILAQVKNIEKIEELTDLIALFLPSNYERKLEYLKEDNATIRVKMLLDDINKELSIIQLEKKIDEEVQKNIEKSQKEFVLREKIKAIKDELGESKDNDMDNLKEKLKEENYPLKIRKRLEQEIVRYEQCPFGSPEVGIIRNYIDYLMNLPWNVTTKDNNDMELVLKTLNYSHYGLDKIKDRIVEYIALKKLSKDNNVPVLCFVGPPGVGKTSLAKAIAKAVGRKTCKISVGGINDEAEIVGHRRTYIGAAPGRIIQGIKKAGSKNPVFIIDEIDKMTKDIKGDPASSLLDVLDKEQNKYFSDHYIEEDFDLSQVMFICTANYINQIPLELIDRLEIIELSSYTEYEKLNIAKYHIIKKLLKSHGLKPNQVVFSDDAILEIIQSYTKEAGVRELERIIASILRKIVKDIVVNKKYKETFVIEKSSLIKYLGIAKYEYNKIDTTYQVGVVNGMSYTPYGGDILPIEVTYFKGKGLVVMTGSLGDVFIESARIAFDYIKSNSSMFQIDFKFLEENDFHIHVPETAVKKDGPSAGIAITTAIISALTNKSIASNLSMTGEITLRGKVLPIGGLKEKIIGAKRANIKKIILPKENEKDLEELDDYIKEDIKFILVSNYEEVYNNL